MQEKAINISKELVFNDELLNKRNLISILEIEEIEEFEETHKNMKIFQILNQRYRNAAKYFEGTIQIFVLLQFMVFHLLQKRWKNSLFLNSKNLNVYTPRLDGHGTTPEDLKQNLARLV